MAAAATSRIVTHLGACILGTNDNTHLLHIAPRIAVVPTRVVVVVNAKYGSGAHRWVCAQRREYARGRIAWTHEGQKLAVLPYS